MPGSQELYHLPGFHEPFSAISHLIGTVVFFVLGLLLLRRGRGDWRRQIFLGIFAATAVFCLAMSGVYHMMVRGGVAHGVLGRLDFGGIYLLIAGTFTPGHGILFRCPSRWWPLLSIWGAAILGLTIDENIPGGGCGRWRAIALGDSCVAHIRGEQVLTCFPLDNSTSFSNRPRLLPSNSLHNKSVIEHLYTVEESWKRGDIFYLMTDALACWFIKETEVGQRPWKFLRELDLPNQDSLFQDWVEGLRASKAMRNDDVTLLLVSLGS